MDKELLKKNLIKKIEDFDGKDHNRESERDICRAYIEPLFAYLGWHMDNTDEVKEQKNEPEGRPDYIFYLNGSIALFLETKKVKTIDEDDIKQALNYGRSRNKRWSVLSNFEETIILICDTKETSLSNHIFRRISYKKMIEDLDSLLLLTRESFETGLIDAKAQDEGRIKKTIRIDEELLNDILLWRKEIIKSIKNENKKEYSKETLEEIAQILLNRIIFIRTVEDRRIEAQADETIKSILNQYENNKSVKIKDKLNRLFEEYDKTYDSKLFTYDEHNFGNRHESEKVEIDNKTYYKILKETYEKNEIYSYKFGDIDADILGEMYERYIGNIQDFKKTQGIYYTPTYVVDYIVNNTLGMLLNRESKKKISGLRILDMACGSGSFLLKAFDSFNDHYKLNTKKYFQSGLDVVSESSRITQKTKILREHIFGVDLDIKAVEIAQLNLLLKIAETKHRLPDLRNNIKQGNSLIAEKSIAENTAFNWSEEFSDKFDIIMGNPPYDVIYSNEKTKEYKFYKSPEGYISAESNPNLFALFIERALSLLKDGGLLSFIIPNSFINNKYLGNLRKLILENTAILQIYDLKKDVFKSANVDTCIIILRKEPNERIRSRNKVIFLVGKSDSNALEIAEQKEIPQSTFLNSDYYSFNVVVDSNFDSIKEKLIKNTIELGDIAEVYRGMVTRNNNECIFDTQKNGKYKPLLSGRDIGRYQLEFNNRYIYFDKSSIGGGCWNESVYLSKEKILVQLIRNLKLQRRLVAAYDNKQYYVLQNCNNIIVNEESGYQTKYILALINSKLINYWFRKLFVDINIKRIYLKQIPIKADKGNQSEIITLVDRLLQLNKENVEETQNTERKARITAEIKRVDSEIDKIVYKMYNLTESEKKIIEESVIE